MQRNILFLVLFGMMSIFSADMIAGDIDDIIEARQRIKAFRLEQVRLLPSPFKTAQDKDAAYLLTVEPDRLLAKFRINNGLEPRAEHYGGWEIRSIAGHSLGHYLSAVSMMYASTGDERFKKISDYIVDELLECQNASDDGLVSAIPDVRKLFADIAAGDIRTQGFDLNGYWVPWYAQHKVYAGLLDAHQYCANDKALEVAKKLGDWGIEMTKDLNDEQFQVMLRTEFGGMNEVYYSLFALTGEEKYLKMGDRFYHDAILKPLSEGRDELQGKHANTQIPKIVGLARRFEVAGAGRNAFDTTKYFWDRVVNHHSYVTGSNSMGEHFGSPDQLNDRLRDDTAETCNTYNMLKLTKKLYMTTGDLKYMEYFERALYNHILPSIDLSDDPNKLFTYFVPLRSGGFRTYSSPNRRHEEQNHHWSCCHGTGMENHAKYNDMIYYHGTENGRDVLYVNLLIPSTLDWAEKGIKVTIGEDYTLQIDAGQPTDLVVKIRVPNNSVYLSNESIITGSYIAGDVWPKGQTAVSLPIFANWKIETMPDNENRIAIFRGPFLYVGDLGPIEKPIAGRFDQLSDDKISIPVIVSDSRDVYSWIERQPSSFSLAIWPYYQGPVPIAKAELTAAEPNAVELVPFYEASQRYGVYFDLFTEEQWAEEQAKFEAEQERLARVAALVVDTFQPGEMQPERDRNFSGKDTSYGEHQGRKWRDARNGGFFEFDMKVDSEKPCRLVLTYWGDDSGNRVFDVIIDGTNVATQRLERNRPGRFFDVSHDIANPGRKNTIRVRLQGHPGAIAGGLFGAETVRIEPENN